MKNIKLEKFVNSIPYNWSEGKQCRAIYLGIIKKFSVDQRFFISQDLKLINKIYENNATIKQVDSDNLEVILGTCKQICQLICEGLRMKGIEACLIGYIQGIENHIDIVVRVEGEIIVLNPYRDITNVRKGFRTTGYGIEKIGIEISSDFNSALRIFFPNEKIVNIPQMSEKMKRDIERYDNELGYVTNGLYMDDVIENLKADFSDEKFKNYLINRGIIMKNQVISRDLLDKYTIEFILNIAKDYTISDREDFSYYRGDTPLDSYTFEKYIRKLQLIFLDGRARAVCINLVKELENAKCIETVIYINYKDETQYYRYFESEKGFCRVTQEDLNKYIQENKLKYLNNYDKIPNIKTYSEDEKIYKS